MDQRCKWCGEPIRHKETHMMNNSFYYVHSDGPSMGHVYCYMHGTSVAEPSHKNDYLKQYFDAKNPNLTPEPHI